MSENNKKDKFHYVYSCDLEANVQVKVGTLEGERARPDYTALLKDPLLAFSGACQSGCSDMYVQLQVLSNGKPLAFPVITSYKSFTTRWNWNEWITLPVRYCDLPEDSILHLKIFDIDRPDSLSIEIGYVDISLFNSDHFFRQGMHDLRLTLKPPRWEQQDDQLDCGASSSDGNQMQRLSKLAKEHRNGQMAQVDWLDRLTFREIELINEKEKRTSSCMYLMIEFPKAEADGLEYTIVYFEEGADQVHLYPTVSEVVITNDTDILLENLTELKHHQLSRSLRSGLTDRDLKPDSVTRDQLSYIVSSPPTRAMTSEEQDLIWKYRFYLSSQKKALTKFLKCVNWQQQGEAQQAHDLMSRWVPVDPAQALEMLGPSFTQDAVRNYAVSRLMHAPDEELLMYLLQLVQALRYENEDLIPSTIDDPKSLITSLEFQSDESRLIHTEGSDQILMDENQRGLFKLTLDNSSKDDTTTKRDLASLLVSRACLNPQVANYLFWYLWIECEESDSDSIKQDARVRQIYMNVMKRFISALLKGGQQCTMTRMTLVRQQSCVEKLVQVIRAVERESGNRKKKIERLQALLADSAANKFNFAHFECLPLVLDPEVKICGIIAEKASLFKSALMPARLTFRTESDQEYVAIFKHGDDLRQDQLILQIIMLMDRLLRRENLDLKLKPYKVLATSTKHGFVQFVDSVAVAEVLNSEGTIHNYFRKHNPLEGGPYGITSDVMDTYIKSCAGYCVVTYLLGVGDRHLDNLLLTQQGHLFHVDFGYILGRDPKPLPPPMKLSKEMVEAMGGVNSEHYQAFRKLCYTAFLHLRRHADVILHLFSLMVDANIPDIALEPDKTVQKVQDKFRLDLSDEEAVAFMQNMIDVSVTAVMAVLVEQLHKFAQYWRK